jgi:hypothetical protein|uniref:type II toxin-antitoxin system HicA family toxin n=1 Tax=Polynucleobacter sp. TaxID=2029855 RepID=UPI0040470649
MPTIIGSLRGYSFTTDLISALKEAGCHYETPGRRGNHDIWFSPITQVYFPIDSKIRSHNTANAILRIAGLPRQFNAYQIEEE